MRRSTLIAVLSLVGTAALSPADTIYLKNGVQVDGKVTTTNEGLLKLQVGDRTVIYRPSEVSSIEQNDRSGVLDREAAVARWQERNAEMTRLTGLDDEQRMRVKNLLYKLQREDERPAAQRELVALQEQMDVFRYLEYRFPGLSDRLSPWALEIMAYIDAKRALPTLREALEKNIYATRAKAIEILGKIGDRESTAFIARGLVDHAPEVRFSAAYALAALKSRQATPALIDLLQDGDRRVRNASMDALRALWADVIGQETYNTTEQWEALWAAQSGTVPGSIKLAALSPLVPPEEEFQDE